MLLVIDVGNTNAVIGIFQNAKLINDWRIRTVKDSTEDEFNVLVTGLFREGNVDLQQINKTLISCVVPPMMSILDAFCTKYLGHSPLWIDAEAVASIMPIRYNNPSEVGADRIVNAIAAYDKYKSCLIVIDFGTATTFDVVSEKGEYLGGAITPGIMISAEALFQKASKLPRVEVFTPPKTAIGLDTASSMKSGIIYGYAGLVDGMVARIKKEMTGSPKVIATGGLAPLISHVAESIEAVESSLTLEGLRIISDHLSGLKKKGS
ncbi:MAG: type III pantothenate kinase [Proteobacteria bacterium]|nr:type III pantothenate kinase [Pseudomonadota bacterium]